MDEQSLLLQDGRRLGYAEYGDPTGRPVFYFHGSGGSRLDRPADVGMLRELGVRLVSTDRPGHGLSDFQSHRRLLDWPGDVDQLADHLGCGRIYVMGWSAGGPHALACAHLLPGRVIKGALVASAAPMRRSGAFRGLSPSNRILAVTARRAPPLARLIRRITRRMVMDDLEKASRRLMSTIPEADKAMLYAPENLGLFIRSVREGYRAGWQGIAQDDILISQDWGFDLAEVRVAFDIWQGEADVNVPCHTGRYLRDTLPNAHATFLPGEGHFFLLKRWGEVLAALVSGD